MDILNYTFFQNALLGVLFVSLASAIIGTYVVSRRMVFITGGITHACFGGLGLGFYLGISPIAVAGVFAVASALGVEWATYRRTLREDSAISVIWSAGMALGILFVFLTPGYVPELQSFLFGNILTITATDLVVYATFLAVLLMVMAFLFRPICTCAFDADFARTIGMPVRLINGVMTVLVSICIVLTLKLIGIMMLMSLFALPQMTAELFTSRLRPMMFTAAVVSVAGSVAGLFAAYYSDIPASATIVLTLIACDVVARMKNLVCR